MIRLLELPWGLILIVIIIIIKSVLSLFTMKNHMDPLVNKNKMIDNVT